MFLQLETDMFVVQRNEKRMQMIFVILKNIITFQNEELTVESLVFEIYLLWFRECVLFDYAFTPEMQNFIINMINFQQKNISQFTVNHQIIQSIFTYSLLNEAKQDPFLKKLHSIAMDWMRLILQQEPFIRKFHLSSFFHLQIEVSSVTKMQIFFNQTMKQSGLQFEDYLDMLHQLSAFSPEEIEKFEAHEFINFPNLKQAFLNPFNLEDFK